MTRSDKQFHSPLLRVGLTLSVIWVLCLAVFSFSMIGELWVGPELPKLAGYMTFAIYMAPFYPGFLTFQSIDKGRHPISCIGLTLLVTVVCHLGMVAMMLIAVQLRISHGLSI